MRSACEPPAAGSTMVKFGKQLVESRVVEWETYYIDYKTLKKLLKRGDEGHGVPGAACDAFEAGAGACRACGGVL